jgi:D-galacturonate reductase
MSSTPSHAALKPVNVLMVGTGEYTTGYVHGTAADSDKGAGHVPLVSRAPVSK